MRSLFGLLYTVLLFSYIATALFIVFHIVRYSFKRSSMLFGITLFLVVLCVLVFINALIFFSLPMDKIFSNSF